jgi:hypothetical protein
MTIDHNLVYLLGQLVIVVWYVSRLNQKVVDLEKGFLKSELSHEKIKSEIHELSLVMARSDEKLVQLVRNITYENGSNYRAESTKKPRRKALESA